MRPTQYFLHSPGTPFPPLRRFILATLMVWSALGLYFVISIGQSGSPATVVMPSWVPFWPTFTLPYLGLLLMGWILPMAIRDSGRFRACLRAMIYTFLMVITCWIMFPTQMHRPPLPEGWWVNPYRWLATIDPPHCVTPCGHVIGAVAAAWFLFFERPTWRWPLAGMLVVGLPSIAFVGQHRPIDILIGTVFTAIGIVIGETIKRRERLHSQTCPF